MKVHNNYYWPAHRRRSYFSFSTAKRVSSQPSSSRRNDDNNDSSVDTTAEGSSFTGPDRKALNREFGIIAIPALIQLTAEPLAGLVDTAYLGRMGAQVLGGAGVAISAHYAVSKLYNDPLLRTSISLVATAGTDPDEQSKAVSSALLLAATVGILQMILYLVLGTRILSGMGVDSTNIMFESAMGYLKVRAYGSPAATLWLVTNGIFRGLGDTKTPLYYSIWFTMLNAILDPIFIFVFHWGAAGAAAGTTVAQYAAVLPLIWSLHAKVPIRIASKSSSTASSTILDIKTSLQQYINAGTKVLVRTIAKVWCYSICARQAALLGPIGAAAYNLTFQLGFAVTQICESIAIAVQTLMAREMGLSSPRPNRIRHLIQTSVLYGGSVAISLSLVTFLRRDSLLKSLTTNVGIQTAAMTIFPVVLLTQVAKGFCYPINGILMGGLDWSYTMGVMWLANAACVGVLMLPQTTALVSLERIWWGLCAFMTTQVVMGMARYQSRTGPWKILRRTTMPKTIP